MKGNVSALATTDNHPSRQPPQKLKAGRRRSSPENSALRSSASVQHTFQGMHLKGMLDQKPEQNGRADGGLDVPHLSNDLDV
eukprot:7771369-Pyramimonas_sp.AAC.1